MSAVPLAAVAVEPVGVLLDRHARAVLPVVRHVMEYLHDSRTLSRLRPSVDLDVLPQLRRLVAA